MGLTQIITKKISLAKALSTRAKGFRSLAKYQAEEDKAKK